MTDRSPRPGEANSDRFLRCQEYMESAISAVAEGAIMSGWSPEEVAAALVELADNQMLALLANRGLTRELAAIMR